MEVKCLDFNPILANDHKQKLQQWLYLFLPHPPTWSNWRTKSGKYKKA